MLRALCTEAVFIASLNIILITEFTGTSVALWKGMALVTVTGAEVGAAPEAGAEPAPPAGALAALPLPWISIVAGAVFLKTVAAPDVTTVFLAGFAPEGVLKVMLAEAPAVMFLAWNLIVATVKVPLGNGVVNVPAL